MKDFHQLLISRRSIRKYTDELLTPEEVQLLLSAPLLSPSSKRSCSWEFIVVENKETLARLAISKAQGAKPIENAALAIVVLGDPLKSDVWIEDASIASILIQLQAEDMGLGSCWIQIRSRVTTDDTASEEYVRELLNIPNQLQPLSIITVGHKDEERKPFDEEKMQWEKVHIEKW